MRQLSLADRGQSLSLDKAIDDGALPNCLGVARLGSLQTAGTTFTVWMQVRGSAWVESKEGKFRLRQREWIAFEKDSKPMVQAGRDGLCIGLSLSPDALRALGELADCNLYAGRGTMTRGEMRVAMRLWRDALTSDRPMQGLRPALLHLAALQQGMATGVQRCPGRSRSRKRQVFGRMQRARLYLEGNSHRVVRIGELAELTNFSSWYLSKTFQSLYAESPQSLSARLRLERAADLLRDTDMMVGEVAAASGFDNCCSFARAFRARFGLSASRYREAGANLSPESAKSLVASRK
ncbi:helix-turn-helix transcriptional regulator [Stenotrophomonas sp. TWI700]|jgi:AraC family transcriptional regulator|uniref:helix-turn-helix transcriptional regulator n=1 Tax=Stenotrophomonas TaxID=40323 RepID=UPI00131187EE|nr:helix-turn-helix transcriptional regulator [Stenotrophomonas sp. SAM-B]NWF32038.1 helix-turn-helix transcriptional regulator [Stenotrophomonas sp. SAM-B]